MSLLPKRSTPRRTGKPSPRIKPGRVEDPEHLKRVRALPCIACQMDGRTQTEKTEAHHPREDEGMGTKADDHEAIALCSRHHNEQHPDSVSIHRNPVQFWSRYGTEGYLLARTIEALNTQETE